MGYIFDPQVLQQCAKDAIGKNVPTEAMVQALADKLAEKYPGHISTKQCWVFNNAGGAMGAMWVLHASLSEYVIIFGTPCGTEGHSGRFFATDYFTILEGEQWAFSEGQLDKEIFRPGEMHVLPAGSAKQYKMPDKCWALEYARGAIPLMMPFGIADTLFSTLDFVTLFRTFWIYGSLVVKELLQFKI